MTTVIDLGNLGGQGFVIDGGRSGDFAGSSVACAGDVNGDGYVDLLVGAPRARNGHDDPGIAYIIFGRSHWGGPIDLGELSPADGLAIVGKTAGTSNELVGASVSSAGDFNGDGVNDLIVGAPGDLDAGAAYLIYGNSSGLGSLSLANLTPADGFKISGGVGDNAATSVSSAGDVNGDGLADVIVGSPTDDGGDFHNGSAYVIFGRRGGYSNIDLKNLTEAEGFTIRGHDRGGRAECSVLSAGDVNGDGCSDVIVGAYLAEGSSWYGESYVVFGKSGGFGHSGVIDLANLAPSDGFIMGDRNFGHTGYGVASAGDVNSDGFADVIVGAPAGGSGLGGAAYVVFGKTDGFGFVSLPDLTPSEGFVINGSRYLGRTGWSVASAGDFNGDGYADVIVGIPGGDSGTPYDDEAYVIFGKATGFGRIELSSLAPADGFIIQRDATNGSAGSSVSSAGDIDGDGFGDLIVGVPYADAGRQGAAYVIYGVAPTEAVIRTGTDIANTIRGGRGDDMLEGRGGDDLLFGAQGNDRLLGGEGNDRLTGGADNDALVGDVGRDMLNGEDGDDDLNGGDGKDKLFGGDGNDIIHGGTGNDRLSGGAGDDAIYGGTGKDLLTGGAGADRFHFSLGGTAPDAKAADRIADFSQAEHDLIDLTDYDADSSTKKIIDPFHFVGTSAFSGAVGELRYESAGEDTLVSGDTDGDRAADFIIRLTGHVALTEEDFLLVAAPASSIGGHLFLAHADLAANPMLHLA